MKNIFAQSGEKTINLFRKHLFQTQITLAIFYFIVAACMLGISGEITRGIFIYRIAQQFEEQSIQAPPRRNPMESPKEIREELREITIIVNSILLTLAGVFGYILAGITLKPIQESYEKEQQFLSNASHELRTPLTILRTSLENLKEKIPQQEKESVEECIEEVDQMTKLLENILTLSRSEEQVQKNEPVNLEKIIEEAKGAHAKMALEKNILLDEEEKEHIVMQGNASLIKRAVENVIENAILYNNQGGTVTISLKKQESSAIIIIKDTGIGMSDEERERSTDRLYRAEKSRARAHGGSGLGLSLVKKICEMHGGSLEIQSEPNKGTTVSLSFPIHNAS